MNANYAIDIVRMFFSNALYLDVRTFYSDGRTFTVRPAQAMAVKLLVS